MKKVAITGINGQVGATLAKLYLQNNYEVYGLIRRSSVFNTKRIDNILDKLNIMYGDLSDSLSLFNFVKKAKPDIFINTAAMSHVRVSFDIPEYTMDVTGTGVVRCLEVLKNEKPDTKFIQMSSSEMFGSAPPVQNENTKFQPQSIYAAAKIAGYYSVINYRNAYNMNASNAICFNTESELRGETFVTRKITRACTRIKLGLQNELYLGNIEALRDWTYCLDTCNAIYKMSISDTPNDYCICSGNSHSIKEFLEYSFDKLNLNYKDYVKFSSKYLRPTEVDHLCGSYNKIKNNLGWEPTVNFHQIIDIMLEHDFKLAKNESG